MSPELTIISDPALFSKMIGCQDLMPLERDEFWALDEDGNHCAATVECELERLYVFCVEDRGGILCAKEAIEILLVRKSVIVQVGDSIFNRSIALQYTVDCD